MGGVSRQRLRVHDVRLTGHVIGPNAHWLSKDRSLPMTKGADGFWSITLGPLAPDIYDYGYTVDGVAASDPGNRLNVVEVPGAKPAYYDAQDVPLKQLGRPRGVRHHQCMLYSLGNQPLPLVPYTGALVQSRYGGAR